MVIGVDNGVAPIDQMLVTVTRPIEEAVNSVQGVELVQSITSRGQVEVDLFFSWKVDMYPHAGAGERGAGARAGDAAADGQGDCQPADVRGVPDHGLQPDVGHACRRPSFGRWRRTTLKPRLNRMNGVSTVVIQGGQEPEFEVRPDPAKLLESGR